MFILTIICFIACDEDFSEVKSEVLGKENANFDTNSADIAISAYNKKISALRINNLGFNLLGYFNDPEFGETNASIVTQVLPTSFVTDFGTNPVVDSVILNIPYLSRIDGFENGRNTYSIKDSLYGNPEAPVKLSIYQNNYFLRSFDPNSNTSSQSYFSDQNGGTDNLAQTETTSINFDTHKGDLMFEGTYLPSSAEIVTTIGEGEDEEVSQSPPALRLELDVDFWKSAILDQQGQPEISNRSNFLDYFRGLYFKAEAENNDGNMVLLNLNSSDATITIYYSKGEDSARTQSEYILNFGFTGSIRLNPFINNYNMTFADGDPVLGDETLYLKGTEGSMAVVNLFGNDDVELEAFLNDFRRIGADGEYVTDPRTGDFVLKKLINEAQLVVYESDDAFSGEDGDYHKYDRLYAYDIENNIPTSDYFLDESTNDEAFNSKVVHLTQRNPVQKKFKVRLTQHLNNILLKGATNTRIGLVLSNNVNIVSSADKLEDENGITAVPANTIVTPRGTILHGSRSSDENKRMTLKIFYTEPDTN